MKGAIYDEDSDSSFEFSDKNTKESEDEYTSTQFATVVVSKTVSLFF